MLIQCVRCPHALLASACASKRTCCEVRVCILQCPIALPSYSFIFIKAFLAHLDTCSTQAFSRSNSHPSHSFGSFPSSARASFTSRSVTRRDTIRDAVPINQAVSAHALRRIRRAATLLPAVVMQRAGFRVGGGRSRCQCRRCRCRCCSSSILRTGSICVGCSSISRGVVSQCPSNALRFIKQVVASHRRVESHRLFPPWILFSAQRIISRHQVLPFSFLDLCAPCRPPSFNS